MENQNNKDNKKSKLSLPPLLSGSEYKTDDPDLDRVLNLLGLAVAIMVCAKKDDVSDDCKEAWLGLFEQEYDKSNLYCRNSVNFNARHSHNVTPISDETDYANPVLKMIFDWLKTNPSDTPNWYRLYQLIGIQKVRLKKDPSVDWWVKVQSVCRRAETTACAFDPIAEIWRISEEYRTEQQKVEQPQQENLEEQKSTGVKELPPSPDKVYIDLNKFSYSGSYRLLYDLLADKDRKGVASDIKKYGKKQPKDLQDLLRNHKHREIGKKIAKKDNIIKLDIPAENISITLKKPK